MAQAQKLHGTNKKHPRQKQNIHGTNTKYPKHKQKTSRHTETIATTITTYSYVRIADAGIIFIF